MRTKNFIKVFSIISVIVIYGWLLYNEREIPRAIDILFITGVGISFFGADAVFDLIKSYIDKWKK